MKKVLSVILSVTLLLSVFTAMPFSVSAAETEQESVGATSGATGDCTWTLDDDGNLTISGNGAMGDYSMRPSPWGYNIKTVVIEDGVTRISKDMFSGCTGLTSITIPDSLTSIDSGAFAGTAWYNNQPDGLVYAGKVAYRYKGTMPANTSIIIREGTKEIADYAFSGCTGLTSITIPDSVTSIGNSAFNNTAWYNNQPNGLIYAGKVAYKYKGTMPNNTSITIQDGTKVIAGSAFSGCTGLTSVTIPDSVTSIDSGTFDDTAWYNNQPNGLVYAGKVAYKYKGTMPANTSITIQDGTKGIAGNAFYWCTGLTSVTIPDSVTSIGSSAFYNCAGLTSVTIPNSVTSIGDYAFYGCMLLTSVMIPDSVTSIGGHAFEDCTGLTSISVDSGNSVYDSRNDCNAVIRTATNILVIGCQNTVIPDSVTSVGDYAFGQCYSLTSVTIPDSVTSINYHTFWACRNLTSITIPSSVKSIGGNAFRDCTGLTSVTIPGSVTSIQFEAFDGCTGLTSVTINNGVTSIGDEAFNGCTGLTSVIIPDSVTSIDYYAFEGCTGLTSVYIPDSVTSIGDKALGYYYNSGYKKVSGFTILGVKGSEAERYAKNNGFSFKEAVVCSKCHTLLYIEQVSVDSAVSPSCTETGLTEGTHCSVCGEAIKAQEVIPALGHNKIEDIKFDATCTEDGVLYWHCSRCSELGEDAIHALGHDYKTVVTPLTCTQDGFTTHTCSRCGDKYVTDFTKAPGHSYSAVVTPPTCTQGGFTTHTCTKCGDVYVDSKIGALGHDFNVTVKREPTTSQQGGMTAECKKCDLKKNVLLPALSEQDYTIIHGALTGTEAGKAIYTWKDNTYGSISFKTADTSVLFIGDIDRNGEIEIQDVTILQRHLAEYLNSDGSPIIDETNEEMLRIADINRDGILSVSDVTMIQRYLAEFPVEGELIIPKTKVSSITFSPTSLVMTKGQSQTLTAEIAPSDAYIKTLQWSSSDTSVVDVDQNGKVTAKKSGTAIIYAAAKDGSGKQGSCSVLVSDPNAADEEYIENFNKLVLNIRNNPSGFDGNGNPYIAMSSSYQNGTQFFSITALPSGGLRFYHDNSLDYSGSTNLNSHVSFEANFNNSFMINLYYDFMMTDSIVGMNRGCSGSASIDARNYSDNSTLYYSSLTQNENQTANTDTGLAFVDWDILLVTKYPAQLSMKKIGFKSY